MIVVSFTDFQFSFEALYNELLQFSLFEYMIVSMIYSRLLVLVSDCSLNEATLAARFLGLFFLLYLRGVFSFLLRLLILILEVPGDKDILGLENLVLLLIGPDINEDTTSYFQYTMEFIDSC